MTQTGKSLGFKYNDSGIRTEKTVNGVTTNYQLLGDKVILEDNGTDKINYSYDVADNLLSMTVTKPANIIGGNSDIGIFERSTNKTGVDLIDIVKPGTATAGIQGSGENVRAIRLNKGASIPGIWSPLLGLKANTNYVVEFDYWSDADNVRFDVDLFPDNLPQVYPVAKKAVQSFRWELNSPSAYMTTSNLRFFNDTAATNPENIYITNIRLYETNSNADNIVGGSTAIGVFKIGQMTGAAAVDVVHPQTGNTVSAIRLNAGASIPTARTPQMKLKADTDYIVEFDYWADADNVKFDVDFSPDDLPQVYPVAKKDVQHYKWKLNSSSENMKVVIFRFFNDTVQTNPANIYITNIKLYEANKVAETSKEYFYIRNAQNDIIGLVDDQGAEVVSYTYDSWGKQISASGSLAGSIGNINPYRYRGYRFDSESGLYYLQSRYYNAEWGRFVNADGLMNTTGEINGYNLFAYSGNNPTTYYDPNGRVVETVLDFASIGWSLFDLCTKPSWANLGFFLWDIGATLVPFVPGSYMAKGGKIIFKIASKVDDLKKGIGLTLDSYINLKKIFTGVKNIQVHHLIEKRFTDLLSRFGIKSDHILSIPLTKELHLEFTNAWRKALPYGGSYSLPQVLKTMESVYKDYPELLAEIKKWLKRNGVK